MADRIKTAFRSRILTESAQLIRKQQQETLVEWDLVSSGQLLRQMRGHFSVSDMETGARLDMTYLSYMRFLDIPNARRSLREAKRQGYATYNRIVFGYLYNQTLPQLKYGFTDETKALMANKMKEMASKEIFLLQE